MKNLALKSLVFVAVLAVSVASFAGQSTIQSGTIYNASGSTTDSVVLPATAIAPGAGNRRCQ